MAGNKLTRRRSAATTRLIADPQAEVGCFSESADGDRADPGRQLDYSCDQKR